MRVVARQALLLASKDIRLFFKDRFGFGFAMIFPLMFVFGFSIALSDVGPEDRQLRFAVATEEEQGTLPRSHRRADRRGFGRR